MKKLSSDQFFKKAMENKNTAREFFCEYLPEDIKAVIDIEQLVMSKDSFIDEQLKSHFSDCLFASKSEGEYVYVLIDHKIYHDDMVALQLLRYMVRIWQDHKKKHKTSKHLPLIYPIVLYHGIKEYTAAKNIFELFKNPDLARKYILSDYYLINLRSMSDEAMLKKQYLGFVEYLLKHIRDREIIKALENIGSVIGKIDEETFYLFLYYIAPRIKDENVLDLNKIIENTRGLEAMRSVADVWMEQGMQQGIEQGMQHKSIEIAKKMLSKGLSFKNISEFIGLSQEEIENSSKSPK